MGTCTGTGGLKMHDYFLVSGGLEKAISESAGRSAWPDLQEAAADASARGRGTTPSSSAVA
eukprot:7916971-Pyramimonas_sp.AAC.1